MTIGERIALFRRTYKITQKIFADSVGISQSHISKIENNQDNPSDRLLEKITATWGIKKDWLLNEEGEMVDLDTKLQVNKSQCFTAIDNYMHNYGEASTNEVSSLILKLIHLAETCNSFEKYSVLDGIRILGATLDEIQKVLNFWLDEIHKNGSVPLSPEEGKIAFEEFTEITEIYYRNIIRTMERLQGSAVGGAERFSAYFDKEIDEYLKQEKDKLKH